MNNTFSVASMCSLVTPIAQSTAGYLWALITTLWPWYWFLIVIILAIWIAIEIVTRNGTAHYNSENGFSPSFNRFVGSGTYLGLQTLLLFIFKTFFGEGVYCLPLPYVIHVTVFLSTGLLLHLSGFWPYLIEPGRGRRRRRRR